MDQVQKMRDRIDQLERALCAVLPYAKAAALWLAAHGADTAEAEGAGDVVAAAMSICTHKWEG